MRPRGNLAAMLALPLTLLAVLALSAAAPTMPSDRDATDVTSTAVAPSDASTAVDDSESSTAAASTAASASVAEAAGRSLLTFELDSGEDAPEGELGAGEDMEAAEIIVFKPLFRYRERGGFRRRVRQVSRSLDTDVSSAPPTPVDDSETTAASTASSTAATPSDEVSASGRSSPYKLTFEENSDEAAPEGELGAREDMEGAENIVFKPLFRYRERGGFRRRVRQASRSQDTDVSSAPPTAVDDSETSSASTAATPSDEASTPGAEGAGHSSPYELTFEVNSDEAAPEGELGAGEDMEGAENIVFKPLFRYRERGGFRRRVRQASRSQDTDVSSAPATAVDDSETSSASTAASTAAPTPSDEASTPGAEGAGRSSPYELTFEVNSDEAAPEGELGAGEDMEGAENIVFKPLFRYRERGGFRRRVRRASRRHNADYRRTYAARFPHHRYRNTPRRRNANYNKRQSLV